MNLQENIRKVLKEGVKEKMIKLIDEHGLISAINFVGGWDTLKRMLGDYQINTKLMIDFIKDLTREYGGLSVFDFDESPIFYGRTKTEYREISYFGISHVTVQVWNNETFSDEGEMHVPYTNLNDTIIMEIFELLLEQYEKGIDI
jgi:hypothetical protein